MGEPKPEAPPQSNGGVVKQKPTTLNLASGTSFYRPQLNGRAANSSNHLNDRHLQQQQQQLGGLSNGAGPGRVSRQLKSAIGTNCPGPASNEPNHAQLSALSAVLPVLSGLSAKQQLSSWSALASEYEDQRESPPPPTPASSHPATPLTRSGGCDNSEQRQQQQLNGNGSSNGGLQSSALGQLSARSPSHNGFSLYTPPAPIPPAGSSKIRSVPNGLPQPAPRRPHSIAAPPYHLTALQSITAAFAGRTIPPPASSQQHSAGSAVGSSSPASAAAAAAIPTSYSWTGLSNGLASTAAAAVESSGSASPGIIGSRQQRPADAADEPLAPGPTRSAIPPQSLWNGQQQLPRRPHSIAAAPVSTTCSSSASSSTSSVSSAASSSAPAPSAAAAAAAATNGPANPASTARTPGEPIQWGASGMVLHQPVARRAYASTLPHPHSPTPSHAGTQGPTVLSALTNPGNSNTWAPGASLRARPHSIASTPQGNGTSPGGVAASPSDSGYRSLPSASSDYQLMSKSPSLQQTQAAAAAQSATRRLSLPSAQSLLRATAPRPSPTFHGLPFKPFTCGVSPNGNPIFLGCTHLHGSTGNTNSTASSTGSLRTGTPATSPATSVFNTAQAIQQLLAQHPKNGFKIVDDKLSLFIEILDTQERFAKVGQSHDSRRSNMR
ncbi:hypothetical protein TSAR_005183 [Trichomalopsis sarcophagae]|uniref:Uncharacterized protein n=1 Tax=Trichomalopsis sarcophagae TaxID=543379 RepID=A0A232ES41_9HYME|nr:hypothetical protein TSAR_005183 [Trichomalopsis sarcophagae]